MPPFRVLIDKRAERELLAIPPHVIARFRAVFEKLELDPYLPRPQCDIRVVKGHPRMKAVRVGAYRGLFEVLETEWEVRFMKFGHRRSVYR